MLKSYIKSSYRNIIRNKFTSGLNIVGLAMGLTCTLLIFLYIKLELSYEKQFPKAERIYRITEEVFGEEPRHWAATPPSLGEAFEQYMSQVEKVGRLHHAGTQVLEHTATGGSKSFEEQHGYYADGSVVKIFDLPFVRGNPQQALSEVNAIVLTETTARKYFGDEDPIGKVLVEAYDKTPLKVSGVVRDLPATTHLQLDYLISMPTFQAKSGANLMKNKTWNGFYTYALLRNEGAADAVEARLADFTASFYAAPDQTSEEILASGLFHLQPITSIHLHSKLEKEMGPNGDITYVYIFFTAAAMILLIACINFINIATAQAFKRMKEVGVRKVLGASKSQLISQFLSETLMVTFLAAAVVAYLIGLLLPVYNFLTNSSLTAGEVFSPLNITGMLTVVTVVGLLTGLYPAFLISGANPIKALKGQKRPGGHVTLLRQGLIIFQFAISVFMLISTMVVYLQMEYFHNKNLGFDKEQVIAIKLYGDLKKRIAENPAMFKNQLSSNAAVADVSLVSNIPAERFGLYSFNITGKEEEVPNLRYLWADENLLPTLKIELVEGQNFRSSNSDSVTAFIVNEAAAKMIGLEDPVGRTATSGSSGISGPVVGVVRDFNFASLHTEVEPLIIQYEPVKNKQYALVKVKGRQIEETLPFLEKQVKAYAPGSLFNYTFLDTTIEKMYQAEQRMNSIFKIFACFTLFVSCLGLFGLSAYAAELRTKEIGIRKVLGATERSIVVLLSQDFVKLVMIAILIGSFLAWYFMQQWLQGFAYRIHISWWIFVLAGLTAIVIALATISFHAIKAALRNPVKNMRIE